MWFTEENLLSNACLKSRDESGNRRRHDASVTLSHLVFLSLKASRIDPSSANGVIVFEPVIHCLRTGCVTRLLTKSAFVAILCWKQSQLSMSSALKYVFRTSAARQRRGFRRHFCPRHCRFSRRCHGFSAVAFAPPFCFSFCMVLQEAEALQFHSTWCVIAGFL